MDSRKAQVPSQGLTYERALHTIFALSAINNYTNWKILNEDKYAGKFDDLVFQSDEKCMLLQAKSHKGQKGTKDFMTESSTKKACEFSIANYLLSYITFKDFFKITLNSLILCTSAYLNVADIMDELPADENLEKIFGPLTKKYKIKNEEKMVKELLKIVDRFKDNIDDKNNNKEQKQWKDLIIDREDIKSFMSSFVIVKVSPEEIKRLIKSKLSDLEYEFSVSSYEYVKDRVEEWSNLSRKHFVPMTKDYLMFILCGEQNRIFLHKFLNTKIYFKETNLCQFDSNIICIRAHDNIAIHLLNIFRSIQNAEGSYLHLEENTLCLMQKMENTFHEMKYTMKYKVICDMINTFRCKQIKYLVVSFLSLNEDQMLELYNKLDMITKEDPKKKVFIIIKDNHLQKSKTSVKIIKDKIYFNSLKKETQDHIFGKEIQFQGEIVTLKNLINNTKNIGPELEDIDIDESIKEIIFNEDNYYSIGSNLQVKSKEEKEFYVERSLIANSELFPETKFFEKIDKSIVVLTGPPGAGKTTLLKQIVSLKKTKDQADSKLTWIINVDLKKSKTFFQNATGKTLSDLLCHNENIPDLAHFKRKLIKSMDKMLIIDGLDENCPEDIKKLQNLLADPNSLQASNISLVIMGARDYDFILKKLRLLHSCELVRLSPFSPRNRSSFLKKEIKQIIPTAKIENDVFDEVTNIAPAFKDICSTPLSLKMVSKIIANKISTSGSIGSLSEAFNNVTNVYNFYNCYLKVRKDEFVEGDSIKCDAFDGYIDLLRKFAAKNLFSDNILSLLNIDASFNVEHLKRALNVGVLEKSYEEYKFVHKTFEEYFAAELLWTFLYEKRHSHNLLLEVLNAVFLNVQYAGVSDFFEKILEISQTEKISELSLEYSSALTKVNWKRHISLLCIRGCFFIVKLVFDNYTNFCHILKIEGMSGETAIHYSCAHPSLVKYIVKRGAEVNKADENGLTILNYMFIMLWSSNEYTNYFRSLLDMFKHHKRPKTFEFFKKYYELLRQNQEKDYINSDRANKFLDLLTFLKEYQLNLNIKDINDDTPVHWAAQAGLKIILEKFINEYGLDPNPVNKDKQTPLHYACSFGNYDIVMYYKAINIFNKNDDLIVLKSAESKTIKVLKYLIEDCGMNPMVHDSKERSALHYAAFQDSLEAIKYLQSKNLDFNMFNENHRTSIVAAAAEGNAIHVLEYLVDDCSMLKHVEGNFILNYTLRYDSLKAFKFLLKRGLDIPRSFLDEVFENDAIEIFREIYSKDKLQDKIIELLVTAAHLNSYKIFMYLFDIKYLKNEQGQSLIHEAARGTEVDILKFLIRECAVDLDLCDKCGNTPSHYAAASNALGAIKYLKEQGANLNISNTNKYTLAHIAAKSGALGVLRYLVEDCKMDVTVSDYKGNLPAHMAADGNKVEILRYLRSIGIEINQCNDAGETLIHIAAAADAVDVLNFLINECKFPLNSLSNDGFSPLNYASLNNALKAKQFLENKMT
ncbi:uncharacterized protein [Diabrotica undecimpunctata]|uniref:uncharacterized protein n=1 Tax=Diabrotica undecimpunctata TaxID=50387 RepID=UPI003B63BAA5